MSTTIEQSVPAPLPSRTEHTGLYYVRDQIREGSIPLENHVFLLKDPRKLGYRGDVQEGVTLDYDMQHVHSWPSGTEMSWPCLAHDPQRPNYFKVFRSDAERQREGFILVADTVPSLNNHWKEYTDSRDGVFRSTSG